MTFEIQQPVQELVEFVAKLQVEHEYAVAFYRADGREVLVETQDRNQHGTRGLRRPVIYKLEASGNREVGFAEEVKWEVQK